MMKIRLWLLWPLILIIVGCIMATTNNNSTVDPFNSDSIDVANLIHVQSSGAWNTITADSAHNFPENGSPTRTFLELPQYVYSVDLVTYPCTITGSVTGALNRVSSAPAAGEYRLTDVNSIRGQVIEINSAQWGEVISYDYYGTGTVFNRKDILIYLDDSAVSTYPISKKKVIESGDWNMDTTASLSVDPVINDVMTIFSCEVLIINDLGTTRTPIGLDGTSGSGGYKMNGASQKIDLTRGVGGIFDNANYDSTSFNRAIIKIEYID